MTADAKVGLLLGLFFIVLIAFLINGLPTFLQSASADDVVKTTSIVAPSGPDLVIDNRVTETAQRLVPNVPLRATETPQEVIVLDSGSAEPTTPAPTAVESPVAPQPEATTVIAEQAEQLPLPTSQATRTAVSAAAQTHIVQPGENLAVIAQKYYGPEEGNRRAVIQKLYEANKDVLSSPDKVVVGYKLTIPPLKKSATAAPSASETLLQRFSNLFERSSGPQQTAPAPTPTPTPARRTAEYVVQPGDSLWSIAEKTLGDGHKFSELAEMNKDRLKSPDDVVAGMKLLVPAR